MVCDAVASCAMAVVAAVTLRNVADDVARRSVAAAVVADAGVWHATWRQNVANDGRMSAVDDAVV